MDRVVVRSITADSRLVSPGALFVCLRGAQHDGHAFVPKAVRDGAVAAVAERPLRHSIPTILVPDSRRALAHLAAAFWDFPSRFLDVIGITGTNGKTTTAYMLDAILKAAGRRPALFGTVKCRFGTRNFPHIHTTPEADDLQWMFDRVRADGAKSVAMEVSSHALSQSRVEGTFFRVGVFTNLTRDHLDYHGTMRRYLAAKARLFKHLPCAGLGGTAVLNADSPSARFLARVTSARVIRYGTAASRHPDIWCEGIRAQRSATGTSFMLCAERDGVRVNLKLPGRYNCSNALAAAAGARALGIGLTDIRRGLESLNRVPGRMERVRIRAPFAAIVDYAHTPDALERAIAAARGFTRGKVITVFGCGGNRDRGKRPKMGAVATDKSDFTWVTSDNPRNEDPVAIIEEITAGIRRDDRYFVEPDRRRAIAAALAHARAGDTVLVAGKGHENYQIAGGRRFTFDDVKVLRQEWTRAART